MTRPPTRLLFCLALAAGAAPGQENWQAIGNFYARQTRTRATFSLNLESLRHREGHFEIWEKLTALSDPLIPTERPQEMLTLWAIRCRSGMMAKITEGNAGSFDPRAPTLRFFLPAPASSGAAVITSTCTEVRARSRNARAVGEGDAEAKLPTDELVRPPTIGDDGLEGEED